MSKRISIKGSLFVGVFLSAAFLGGFWYLSSRKDPRDLEIQQLKDVITRLEAERRVAEVVVIDQKRGPAGNLQTRLRFAETAPGRPTASKEFTIDGDIAYFDALVVKFDRAFTKLGDATRGRSLYLFRRVFGERQKPIDGFALDPFDERGVPAAYRLQQVPSDFEREIWRDFWDLALNPDAAKEKGIRVVQGEAIYTRLVSGKIYHLMIEDAGGLSLTIKDAPALKEPASNQ